MDSQQNATGLAVVSDFYAYQFDAIISAIEQAQIPYQIEFFFYIKEAFRVFVSQENLETTRDIFQKIEKSGVIYDGAIALERYNSCKIQEEVKTMTDQNGTLWVKVSDFYNQQLNPTLDILKAAKIPYMILNFTYQGGFRLFVSQENLEQTKEICQIVDTISV